MSETTVSPAFFERAALYCAFGSAVSVLVSIAVSQSLLGLAVALLLLSGVKLRLPPVWLPLTLFMAATLLSMALSGAPAEGLPQVRKFFVYLTLLVVYSTFRTSADARRLMLAWAIAGGAAATVGLVQFMRFVQAAQADPRHWYEHFINVRITGFMSHWMTYSGEQMIALIMLGAFLMFSPRVDRKWLWACLLCAAALSASLLFGLTRGVWLGTAAAALYLLWQWRRPVVLALPVVLAVVLLFGPAPVRTRFRSIFEPKQTDSNQHRIVCWRTGWEMIKAHPWLGLGPEIVKRDFDKYVPKDIPRPLPDGWYGHLHSVYVHYAAERGIPALLILLWFLGMTGWDFLRSVRRLPPGPSDERFLLHGGVAVLIAIMISGISELNLGDSEVLAMFLCVVACGYIAVRKEAECLKG
jgi:putative inorganic carbon (hco3(-)) transporter